MLRKLLHLSMLTLCLASPTLGWCRGLWTPGYATNWYAKQPWMVGANYIPSTAINQLEMWQPETFDPKRIDQELGWAADIGMNTMRVFLHDLLWQQDPQAFKERIGTFLDIAARHHMRIVFVLFDSCWEPEPHLGPQHPPIPGVHNSGWVQSPGINALKDPAQEARLQSYVEGIVGAFARDPRIVGWDLWNEPSIHKEASDRVLILLPKVFAWARSAEPTQPLTSGVWEDEAWSAGNPSPVETVQLNESDVISFHDYHWPETFQAHASLLLKRGRPVWCTEWLARGVGSTVEGSLPIGKRLNVAMFNWGWVDGKTQTRLPWDSWDFPYSTARQPSVWHHDLLHTDGSPYRREEVGLIRTLSSAPRRVVPTTCSGTPNIEPVRTRTTGAGT